MDIETRVMYDSAVAGEKILDALAQFVVPISTLVLDPKNARRHPERNLKAIAQSIAEFGQRRLAVVQREGMIVRAGNGMVEAARSLGWEKIAALVVDEPERDARRFALADNRTAELAEWDESVLVETLTELGTGELWLDDELRLLRGELPKFDPGSLDEQSTLDLEKFVTCPKCEHKWKL